MSHQPVALVVSILCLEDDLHGFCRRLAASLEGGPMYLAMAIATGTQVYPVRSDTVRGSATLLRCEFRMRHQSVVVTNDEVRKLLEQIARHRVLDSYLVDAGGANIGHVKHLAVAS